MFENLIFLVVGAVLGVAADRTWGFLARTSAARRTKVREAQRASKETRIRGAIPRLYEREGHSASLYVPTYLPGGPIAMLGGAGPEGITRPVATQDLPLAVRVTTIVRMPVNPASIHARTQAGAKIWDGDLLFLKSAGIEDQGDGVSLPSLEAGVMNYFGFVSASAAWRAECESEGPHPLLEQHYTSLNSLLANPPRPLALSAAAACVFSTPEGLQIPLARRSAAVVNAMGHLCLAPTFGLEPSVIDHVKSKFDVLKYNFVKEFLEEIYGMEGLDHNAESGILDPDCIFENPEAQLLLAEFDSGRASLRVTGLGAELTDGSLTIALLAQFDSPDFYAEVLRRARPSWEWQKQKDGHQRIRFYPLSSFASDGAAELVPEMANSSVFVLDRALGALDEPRRSASPAPEHS